MTTGTIIDSVKDAISVSKNIIESAERDIAWLVPAPMLAMGAPYNIDEKSKVLIQKGGRVRAITAISSPFVETVRRHLDIGEDIRHVDHYEGVFFLVADKKQSISSFHVNVEELSFDDRIVAFWCEAPSYAEYLLSHFDQAWPRKALTRKSG
jgi:hypothetical protein